MAVGSIIAGLSTLFKVLDSTTGTEDMSQLGELVKKAGKESNLDIIMSGGSMVKFLNSYVLQPTAVISNSLRGEEITEKLLELESDIFTGFYTQVFDILNKVNNVDGNIVISLLSTTNGGGHAGSVKNTTGKALSLLEYDFTKDLMSTESIIPQLGGDMLSIEDNDSTNKRNTTINKYKEDEATASISNAIIRKFNLTMSIKKSDTVFVDVEIPIVVKLNILYVPVESIIRQLDSGENNGWFSRLDDYRSGAISLVDLIFASDLIKNYKNNNLNNNDELNVLITNKKYALLSKNFKKQMVSFEKYYNFLLVTEEDAIRMEKVIKGKFSKDKYKEKVLDRMFSLMLTVVDRDYERVSIYIKDINGTSDISFKGLTKRKSSSDDMGEVYKALLTGRNPVL